MARKTLIKTHIGQFTYSFTTSEINHEENGTVTVYGIDIQGTDSSAYIEDISNSKKDVLRLYNLICEGELYPVHLYDVAEDFLSS